MEQQKKDEEAAAARQRQEKEETLRAEQARACVLLEWSFDSADDRLEELVLAWVHGFDQQEWAVGSEVAGLRVPGASTQRALGLAQPQSCARQRGVGRRAHEL